MAGKHRYHAACRQQSDEGQEELDQGGADRAVDDQQHARDRNQGDQRDLSQAGVADDVQIIGERRRTCDIGLHAGRCLRVRR